MSSCVIYKTQSLSKSEMFVFLFVFFLCVRRLVIGLFILVSSGSVRLVPISSTFLTLLALQENILPNCFTFKTNMVHDY